MSAYILDKYDLEDFYDSSGLLCTDYDVFDTVGCLTCAGEDIFPMPLSEFK